MPQHVVSVANLVWMILGNSRSALTAAGIGVGMVGIVVVFADPWVDITVAAAGIVIAIAGAWEPDWKYLGDVYRIHPETLKTEYRKELAE